MRYKKQGFSLIELSIVLIIIAVVIGLISFSIQARIEAAKFVTTKERMNLIAEAIDNYYAKYGVIPCGAPSVARDDPNYGFSRNIDYNINQTDLCDGAYGRDVPFKVLGLDASTIADGWGNRFAYFWTRTYAIHNYIDNDDRPDGSQLFPSFNNFGSVDEEDFAYVILSFGANGYGAIDDKTNIRNEAVKNKMKSGEWENYTTLAVGDPFIPEPINGLFFSSDGTYNDDIIFYKYKKNLPKCLKCNNKGYSYRFEIYPNTGNCDDLKSAISYGGGGSTNPSLTFSGIILDYDCQDKIITLDSKLPDEVIAGSDPNNYIKSFPNGDVWLNMIERVR